MSKAHLLVADDEENMLMTLRFILEAEGYKVDTAKNGREALNKILIAKENNDPFELIIMDIQMPYVSGLELVDKLKEEKIIMPIIAITGFKTEELTSQLAQRGCFDYIEKPFDEDQLLGMLEIALKKDEKSDNSQ